MFHLLRARDDARVAHFWVSIFLQQIFAFLDNALNAFAFSVFTVNVTDLIENLVKTAYLPARLFQMLVQARTQLWRRRLLRHFGQSFDDSIFRVVKVL